jgi:hypothetical protein
MRVLVAIPVAALLGAAILIACQDPGEGPEAPSAPAAPVPAPAAKAPPAPVETATSGSPSSSSAIFEFAALEPGEVQPLIVALAEDPGVISAKPDVRARQLAVIFDSGKTSPAALLDRLVKLKAGASLKGVSSLPPPAAGPEHECGGCPFHDSCGGHGPQDPAGAEPLSGE